MDRSILNIFKYVVIVLACEAVIVFLIMSNRTNRYERNLFELYINNEQITSYILKEKYNNAYLITYDTYTYEGTNLKVNKIDFESPMILTLKEYEIYSNGNKRVVSNLLPFDKKSSYTYNEIINERTLEIQRMNKVLYKGKYIEDISEFINEKGRYYLKIENKRADKFWITVDTVISFNVIVGGGNI